MASSKSASVKLSLNPSNFIKGLKDIDKQGEKTAKRLESLFGKALSKLEKDVTKASQHIEKSFKGAKISINSNGLINQINKTEMKAEGAARNIGKSFQKAFGASAGGLSDATRKLDRAIKELERAQKRLERAQGQSATAKSRREAFELRTKRRGEIWAQEDKNEKRDDFRGAMGGVAGGIGAGIAGVAAIGGAVYQSTINSDYHKNANNVLEKANRVSIASRGAGEDYVDPKQLSAEWYAITQNVQGVTADALGDAVGQFVTITGDLKTARGSIKDFAKVALATNTPIEDVAAAAAAIAKQFKITDPKQIQDVLATLTYQGKSGSFELSDAASLMPKMAAAGAGLGGLAGVEGVKTLGGLSQISKDNYGSAEESVTAIQSLIRNFTKKSDKLRNAGVNVYDEKTGVKRNLRDLIFESIEKVGGTKQSAKEKGLSDIFDEGFGAISGLVKTYNTTFAETKGPEKDRVAAARKAVEDEFNKVANAAGGAADVQRDFEQTQKNSSAKVMAAQEQIASLYSQSATPKINTFLSSLKLTPEALNTINKALGLATDLLLGFAGVLQSFGIIDKEDPNITAKRQVAENLRKEEAGYQNQIAELGTVRGVAPKDLEQWKKEHAPELEDRRKRIQELMIKRDAAGSVASQKEADVKAYEDQHEAERVRKMQQYGLNPASNQTPAAPSPLGGSVDVKNTVNVRITNANDLKGNQPPLPGHSPRP